MPVSAPVEESSFDPPAPPGKRRKGIPGSGYMLFVNENFTRVREELAAQTSGVGGIQPSFSSIAKEAAAQWRALSRQEQGEYTSRAAALRETARPQVTQNTQTSAPESAPRATGGAFKGKSQSLQSYKRKWVEQELAKYEEKLRAEWEAFSADEVSAQLMAFKVRGLPGNNERLGSTLDAVVSQRLAEAEKHTKRGTARVAQWGLADAHLPHPANLYAEWEASDLSGAELEAATAECLRRYRTLPPQRLAAWWAVVASRARRQEENIRNILSKNLGLVEAMMDQKEGDPSRGTAFDHFRAERLAMSATTVLRLPDEGAEGEHVDPLWELTLEEDFLNLDEGDLMRWFPENSESMAVGS
eukprot:symbB.v1.2.035181.t1/scaffold4680.1/size38694/4